MFQDNSKESTNKFIIVFIALILAQAASHMVFLFVPLHLTTDYKLDFSITGQVHSAALFLSIIFTFIGGWLSDIAGRIRTIFIAVLIATTGCILKLAILSWQAASIAFILSSIASAILGVAFWVYVIENSSWRKRGLFIGLVFGIEGYFNKRSQGFATDLINRIDEPAITILGLIVFLISIGLLIWVLFQHKEITLSTGYVEQTPTQPLKKALLLILLIQVVSQFGFTFGNLGGLTPGMLSIPDALGLDFSQDVSLIHAQFAFMGTSLMLLVMIASGWLSDRYGERRILIIALLLACTVGFLPFIFFKNFYSLLSQILIIGLCRTMFLPAINSFLSKTIPEHKRSIIFGAFSGLSSILFLILFPIQIAFIESFQVITPFVLFLLLLGAFLIWRELKSPIQNEESVLQTTEE